MTMRVSSGACNRTTEARFLPTSLPAESYLLQRLNVKIGDVTQICIARNDAGIRSLMHYIVARWTDLARWDPIKMSKGRLSLMIIGSLSHDSNKDM